MYSVRAQARKGRAGRQELDANPQRRFHNTGGGGARQTFDFGNRPGNVFQLAKDDAAAQQQRISAVRVDQYWCLDLYVNGAPVRPAIHWDSVHSGLEKFEKSGFNKARLSSTCLRFSNRLASGTLRYYIKKALSYPLLRCHFRRSNYFVNLRLSLTDLLRTDARLV